MLDSGNDMTDNDNEVIQPAEAVAADVETTGDTPQVADTEDTEFFVDVEGGQAEKPKTNMSQEQAYAAFRKEKEKRQRKNEELEAAKIRESEKDKRIERLEAQVGNIVKGKPPTLESCEYDEDVYQKKVQEYYSNPKQETTQTDVHTQDTNQPKNDMAEFYLYQKEQELSKQLPDYDQNKSELLEKFKQFGGNEQTMVSLAGIAQQAGVDIAKANMAMNKVPGLVMELNQAAASGNQFAIAEVLKKAEGKIKTRKRNHIDTQPEPNINPSGPIDNSVKAVDKLRKEWVTNPTSGNFKAYQNAKKKLKGE